MRLPLTLRLAGWFLLIPIPATAGEGGERTGVSEPEAAQQAAAENPATTPAVEAPAGPALNPSGKLDFDFFAAEAAGSPGRYGFSNVRWLIFLLLVLCLPACTIAVPDIPSAPAHPTYDNDVHPYIADHCLVCHSSPPDNGAPSTFRLDVFNDPTVSGAGDMALEMINDAVYSNPHQMPPGGGLGSNGKQLLLNWLMDGAPRN
jgi:hypothetical protein